MQKSENASALHASVCVPCCLDWMSHLVDAHDVPASIVQNIK